MNREIKFRGKNKDIGWVEGQVAYDLNEDTYIIREVEQDSSYGLEETMLFAIMWYRVDKETIGQYTGLHDKNGKEIYEGDIVYCQTKYGKAKAVIEFYEGKFVAHWDSTITHPKNGRHIAYYEINKRFEVIGNLYENNELLGGE